MNYDHYHLHDPQRNVKRNYIASLLSQTSAEWQVDKIIMEVTSLAL